MFHNSVRDTPINRLRICSSGCISAFLKISFGVSPGYRAHKLRDLRKIRYHICCSRRQWHVNDMIRHDSSVSCQDTSVSLYFTSRQGTTIHVFCDGPTRQDTSPTRNFVTQDAKSRKITALHHTPCVDKTRQETSRHGMFIFQDTSRYCHVMSHVTINQSVKSDR